MPLTHYASNIILNALVARTPAVSILGGPDVYVGLSTTEPTKESTSNWNVTEPSTDHGYARSLLAYYDELRTLKMGAAEGGKTTSIDIIYFPEVTDGQGTGAWGECTHFCIWDAPTSGKLLAFGELVAPITPVEGQVVIIKVGDLTIEVDPDQD